VVLEKTLASPLDCKEIQPVHPKGDQSWVFIEKTDVEAETPILRPPDGKSLLSCMNSCSDWCFWEGMGLDILIPSFLLVLLKEFAVFILKCL